MIVEFEVSAKEPVFVVAPVDGTLPVPVHPLQTYWVVPDDIGELTEQVKTVPLLFVYDPILGVGNPKADEMARIGIALYEAVTVLSDDGIVTIVTADVTLATY